jgi:hypothetical protein
MPEMFRRRYLVRRESGYEVNAAIRAMVRFEQCNLSDPSTYPAAPQDVILCQNVFIYFREAIRAPELFEDLEDLLALAEAVEEHRHGADIESVRAQPHEVAVEARELGEHDAHPLGLRRNFQLEELLHCQAPAQVHGERRQVIHAVGRTSGARFAARRASWPEWSWKAVAVFPAESGAFTRPSDLPV